MLLCCIQYSRTCQGGPCLGLQTTVERQCLQVVVRVRPVLPHESQELVGVSCNENGSKVQVTIDSTSKKGTALHAINLLRVCACICPVAWLRMPDLTTAIRQAVTLSVQQLHCVI